MIAIKKFKYNNFMSTDFPQFDLICDCAFDEDNGGVSSHLSREAVASESYRGTFKRVHNLKYTDVFSFQVTLLKGDFGDFSKEEQRQVMSWLTSKNTASMIDFYDDIDASSAIFSIMGFISEIETYKITNSRTIGYIITFESVNPYALSPLYSVTKIITTPQTFTVICNTDEYEELIYPKVVITEGNSIVVQADHAMTNMSDHIIGTVYKYGNTYYWVDGNSVSQSQSSAPLGWDTTSVFIENLTTNTQVKIGDNIVNEVVTLDGTNRVVGSSRPTGRIFGNNFNWQWLPLKKGSNSIKVTGNCTITITYRTPMKIGEW